MYKTFTILLCIIFSLFTNISSQSLPQNDVKLFPVRDSKTGLYGFVDADGNKQLINEYDDVETFSEGLAWIRKGKKSFFIDEYGNRETKKLPSKLFCKDTVEGIKCGAKFVDGLVNLNRPIGSSKPLFIDKNGETRINKRSILAAKGFAEELAPACITTEDNKILWGFVDADGKFVIPPKYQIAYPFSEGLALVKIDNEEEKRIGFIDKNGDFAFDLKEKYPDKNYVYDVENGNSFSNGLAVVRLDTKFVYINKNGEVVIGNDSDEKFDEAYPFSDCGDSSNSVCLAKVKIGDKYGYIDEKGEQVIKPQFEYARAFKDGMAVVSNEKIEKKPEFENTNKEFDYLKGYINGKGELKVEQNYLVANDFENGLALVRNDYDLDSLDMDKNTLAHTASYIDKNGKTKASWSECKYYSCQPIVSKEKTGRRVINTIWEYKGNGEIIFPTYAEKIPFELVATPEGGVKFYIIFNSDWRSWESQDKYQNPEDWVKEMKRRRKKRNRKDIIDFIAKGEIEGGSKEVWVSGAFNGKLVFIYKDVRCLITKFATKTAMLRRYNNDKRSIKKYIAKFETEAKCYSNVEGL